MPEINEIEDRLITTVRALPLGIYVDSIGRDLEPPAGQIFDYPYASLFFDGDQEVAAGPRPIDDEFYGCLVSCKNLGGEQAAAADAYVIINAIRTAIRGKTLGFEGIEPFRVRGRKFQGYEDGVITYLITISTRQYQTIPTPD